MSVLRRLAGGSAPREERDFTWNPYPLPGGFMSGYGSQGYQGYQVTGQVEKSTQVVAVFACLRAISEAISTLPLRLYEEADGGKSLKRVPLSDPVQTRLGRYPHPRIPAGEFYGLIGAHLAGWGNAFVWKDRKFANGPVTSLFPVLPSMVSVQIMDDGEPEYTVTLVTGERKVTRRDVLHIRAFGVDGIVGLSPIGVARKAIQSMQMEEQYRLSLYENDARVSGILTTDGNLSDEAAARIAAQWKAAHGGSNNAGGTAVLESGMKWQQMSLSTADMQFIEQREYSVAEIARLFRVPPSIVNAKSSGSLTYSTTESEGLAFVRDCLMPYLRRIEQALDQDFELVPERMCPEFDVDGLLRADAKTRAEVQNMKLLNKTLTLDEARAQDGREPVEVPDVAPSQADPDTEVEVDA